MLNDEQLNAIKVIDKPLTIIAGPGTGKTTLISEKIKHLIENNFSPNEILAITFTNKAAQEMSSRVEKISNKPFQAKTFHSFALDLIEEFSNLIPQIDKDYILIEENNQLLFFLEHIKDFNLNSIELKNNFNQIAYDLQSSISKLKDFGIHLKDLENLNTEKVETKIDLFSAYAKYEEYKRKNNFLDFGDILIFTKSLLEKNPKVKKTIQERYKYILIDEFQDTNQTQLDIIKLISKENNITIVGDKKQSIYSFRGANYKNLENFKDNYKNYEELYLKENYRSSEEIINNLNKVITKISNDKETIKSNSKEKGNVNLFKCETELSQKTFIVQKITDILSKDKNSSIGILTRKKSEIKEISKYLKKLNIYHNSNEISNLFEEEIIKEILLILKFVDNPLECNLELFSILNSQHLRKDSIQKISKKASLKKISLYETILYNDDITQDLEEDDLILQLKNKLERIINLKKSKINLDKILDLILIEFKFYEINIENEVKENIETLNLFTKLIQNYISIYKNHSIEKFLNICSLSKKLNLNIERNQKKSNIELLTIHASKGKEFDYVILPYLNSKKLPNSFQENKFDLNFSQTKQEFLDEELRLFFVALSRAKLELNLTYINKYDSNKLESKPTEFLNILNLKEKIFSTILNETEFFDKEKKFKLKILKKINSLILENKFSEAKEEIECMDSLFSKSNNLSKFIISNSKKLNTYKQEFENENQSLNLSQKPIYSVSQLKTFEACPRKYMYQYIYKIPGKPKHYFDFGTTMHTVLENLIKSISKDSDSSIIFNEAVSLLHKHWISKGYETAIQEKEYFQKGLDALKSYIEQEIELKKEERENIALEMKFLLDINGKKMLGFIDRVDKVNGEFEIIDYKTSNSMMPKPQLKEDMQLYVYAMAIKSELKKYPKEMGLWYLVHNKISKISLDEEMLEKIKLNIMELIKKIEEKDFIAKPSFFNCKFCDYNQICKFSKEN